MAAGERVFYDIYSEEEKEADPSKEDTGLFFFRGNPGEKFAVVNAEGGFMYVGAMQSRLQSLESLGIPTEFHAYEGLPHGFGIGTGTVAEGWINDAVAFWEAQCE